MSKLYVPAKSRTPVDRVREALDRAERAISNLKEIEIQSVELCYLLDQIDEALHELEQQDVDVRVERTKFETIKQRLERHPGRFLDGAGQALREEREKIDPDPSRWWWFLDEAAARQQRRRVLRVAAGVTAVIALLAGAWFAYDAFLAPPPEVSQAFRRMEAGRSQFEEGNPRAALADFTAATTLNPEDPDAWLWKGALHEQLGEPNEADEAFTTARRLYETTFGFFLNRGRIYLESGTVEKAKADVKTAIDLDPTSGWGYYLRAGTAAAEGDFEAALADLGRAGELAGESGDVRLQSMAATMRARLMQMRPAPTPG